MRNCCQQTATTVDRTSDHGYLDYARSLFFCSNDHTDTDSAVENLLQARLKDGKLNIIGHGMVGLINTGTGENGCAADLKRCISINNPEKWRDSISRLKTHVSSLTLWSCDTGAEQDGVNLLYSISKCINAPVAAPTGIICSEPGRIWLGELGAKWQVVYPDKPKPSKIDLPSKPSRVVDFLYVPHPKTPMHLPLKGIESITVFPSSRAGRSFDLKKPDAHRLLRSVDLEYPEVSTCDKATIVTSRIELKSAHGRIVRAFLVHNNRILQDVEQKAHYYFSFGSSFRDMLMPFEQQYL